MTDGYYSKTDFEALHFDEPLSPEAERQLIAEWQHLGWTNSRDRVILHFALYASTLAHKFGGSRIRVSPEDCQDALAVANSALLKAVDTFDLGRPKARFSSLLYIIVRRDVINWSKREGTHEFNNALVDFHDATLHQTGGWEPVGFLYPAEPGDAAEAEQDRAEDAESLLLFIPLLPAQEQTVIRKMFFDRQGAREIGRQLGMSQSEVVKLKNSAFEALRQMLSA